jgi:hypothetical protein
MSNLNFLRARSARVLLTIQFTKSTLYLSTITLIFLDLLLIASDSILVALGL